MAGRQSFVLSLGELSGTANPPGLSGHRSDSGRFHGFRTELWFTPDWRIPAEAGCTGGTPPGAAGHGVSCLWQTVNFESQIIRSIQRMDSDQLGTVGPILSKKTRDHY